jgi:hypothetical protein
VQDLMLHFRRCESKIYRHCTCTDAMAREKRLNKLHTIEHQDGNAISTLDSTCHERTSQIGHTFF